jgi:L-rhamnose 1-dehydrogenase
MPAATWERTRQVNLDGSFYVVQGWKSLRYKLQFMYSINALSCGQPDEISNSPRWLYHRDCIYLRSRWWCITMVGSKLYFFAQSYLIRSHYTPTKAGILSLMQSCAVALGQYNIRCNAILPGTIQTDINKEDLSDAKKKEYMIGRTALGRLGGQCFFRVTDQKSC